MTKTPEGFLICHNVPIARTGWQEYLGQEIGLADVQDKVVQVYRSPEEVFSPAAMASFEGKSVTDEHPPDTIRPDNYSSYEKGQITNVRQGNGDESDLLLGDLVVKDPKLISEIENETKREVSCGYDCSYPPLEDGKYQQTGIRGNHVAVVSSGRAGSRVAIKDESLKKPPERRKKMKLDPHNLWGKMLSAFAKDAEPEELAAAAQMGPKEEPNVKDNMTPAAPQPPQNMDEEPASNPALAEINKKIDTLAGIVQQLVESDKQVHSELPKEGLDALEVELETPEQHAQEVASGVESGEESVTIPAEQMADSEAGPVSAPADRPENPIPGADRNAILNQIRVLKPIIAAIPDAAERKKASDAAAKVFRDQLQMSAKPAVSKANGYAVIQKAVTDNIHKAQDQKPVKTDDTDLGHQWAKKHNPHYKEDK